MPVLGFSGAQVNVAISPKRSVSADIAGRFTVSAVAGKERGVVLPQQSLRGDTMIKCVRWDVVAVIAIHITNCF